MKGMKVLFLGLCMSLASVSAAIASEDDHVVDILQINVLAKAEKPKY